MPESPSVPSMQGTEQERLLAGLQGAERPVATKWGVDYDNDPVDDAHNHFEAILAANLGQPSVEEQMKTHGQAPPFTPVLGHGKSL